MRKKFGTIAIFILTLIPLLRWFFLEPLNYRFFNLVGTLTSLGQIAGILGFALFSINLIISARIKFLERFFYGLNNVYSSHHQIGSIAFSLILFHPLLLLVSYLSVSLKQGMDFLTPFKNIPITYGIFSLLLMVLLMVLTFYVKIKYNRWKFSHKFMVVAFVLALLHAMFISSDISRDYFLRVYLIILAFLGLGAGAYQAFVSKLLNSHVIYNLKHVNILNSQVVELELIPKNRKIKFSPGQFVFIRFLSGSIGSESHPFSISSSNTGDNLQVVIKSLGDFTDKLKNLEPGIPVSIEGPYGKFSHHNIVNKNQVWIAGGVGITPFVSMARSLNEEGYSIDLYYCVNRAEEAVLLNELKELELNKKIRLIPWYSSEKGYLSAEKIAELSPGLENKDILLCGPAPFMFGLKKQLVALNIKSKNIHFENFKLL
ncbi:MAG: ferric reductase-like transmembrane domain-containing protein [Candidatus Falkowbacteria bacterium]